MPLSRVNPQGLWWKKKRQERLERHERERKKKKQFRSLGMCLALQLNTASCDAYWETMPGERDADKYFVLSIEERLLKKEENLVACHAIHTYRLPPFQPQDKNYIWLWSGSENGEAALFTTRVTDLFHKLSVRWLNEEKMCLFGISQDISILTAELPAGRVPRYLWCWIINILLYLYA